MKKSYKKINSKQRRQEYNQLNIYLIVIVKFNSIEILGIKWFIKENGIESVILDQF